MLGLQSNGFAGISFNIDYSTLKLDKREFRKKLLEHYEKESELKEKGFRLENEVIWLPFCLDERTLVDEYPDDLDTTFEPVREALNAIREVHPILEKIKDQIISESGEK